MPLHLLGKKSWNVYNADNIARVRRDEAAAKAAEEAEEQRMQEVDAQRRLAILKGEALPPIEDEAPKAIESPSARHSGPTSSKHRKRKRPGEDDTEFELRVAKEKNDLTVPSLEVERKLTSSAPIMDHAGHIDLFGDEKLRAHAEKNEDAVKELKKKERSFEDQYTMRFSNAAGKDGISDPWYSQSDASAPSAAMKDVWGNDDPNRKSRDTQRIVSSDPLAMMKQGASKVRELKRERKQLQDEQADQLRQLRREERHREKRQRRHEERERGRERDETSRHFRHRRRSSEGRDHHHDRQSRDRREQNGHEYRHARRREQGNSDREESHERHREKRSRDGERRRRRFTLTQEER